jgi:hypothetical protein
MRALMHHKTSYEATEEWLLTSLTGRPKSVMSCWELRAKPDVRVKVSCEVYQEESFSYCTSD